MIHSHDMEQYRSQARRLLESPGLERARERLLSCADDEQVRIIDLAIKNKIQNPDYKLATYLEWHIFQNTQGSE